MKNLWSKILASGLVVMAVMFGLATTSDAQQSQFNTPLVRANGDMVTTPFKFRFNEAGHLLLEPTLLDTLVGGDTTNAAGNVGVEGIDALWLSWTTTDINNMDSTFVKFQGSMLGGTWTDLVGAHVRDTMTSATTREKALTAASFAAYPLMRAVVFQKNQAGNTATDSVSVHVSVKALFKGR